MNTTNNNQKTNNNEDFWNSLQSSIISSEQSSSFYDDALVYLEQNSMFSLFFRSFSQLELIHFESFFRLKSHGYLILIEFLPKDNSNKLEDKSLDCYRFIKKVLSDKKHFTVGHLIANRISILVTEDYNLDPDILKQDSLSIGRKLIDEFKAEFDIDLLIGIGNLYNLNSIFTSFVESLSSLAYCQVNQVALFDDINANDQSIQIDYDDAMRHMNEAIVRRKPASYDYFSILIEKIKPFNDTKKRNKLLEILVTSALTAQATGETKSNTPPYTDFVKDMEELSGDDLIEWAFKTFITITGYVRPKTTIDYSNDIVRITHEYLEAHYADEITLEDVAEQVNISPQYFSKLIKKNTGFNFTEWLSMIRIQKAKELLTNTNLTVKEVCFKVGYKDPNYFSRIFKKRMGMTPSEYIRTKSYYAPKS